MDPIFFQIGGYGWKVESGFYHAVILTWIILLVMILMIMSWLLYWLPWGPVYKLPLQSSEMVYLGSSFGLYHSRWTQTHGHTTPGDVYTRTHIKGNNNAVGFSMFMGFSFPIYHDFLFIETGYSVIESIWTLENEDENTYVELKINTGGTSIDIGLQFSFHSFQTHVGCNAIMLACLQRLSGRQVSMPWVKLHCF